MEIENVVVFDMERYDWCQDLREERGIRTVSD
jgi:hypothetical protein